MEQGCNGEVECKLRSEKSFSVSVQDAAVGESMWAAFIRSRLMVLIREDRQKKIHHALCFRSSTRFQGVGITRCGHIERKDLDVARFFFFF